MIQMESLQKLIVVTIVNGDYNYVNKSAAVMVIIKML